MFERVTFTVPITVVSELNWRGCWQARHARMKRHKAKALVACMGALGYRRPDAARLTIHLTRIKGPRQRDFDSDNLAASFKGIRDGIAHYLGIDDGSSRLEWVYTQKKGAHPGVEVSLNRKE